MRRAIAGVGRFLVTLGLLILLFVAYQLWGTGLITARAQDDLEHDFEDAQAAYARAVAEAERPDDPVITAPPVTDPSTTTTTTTVPVLPALPPLVEGEVLGKIVIPKIGVDWLFVEGTGVEDLKKGPGHYPGTPIPGQRGNAAIAGHRTTYGQPFHNLDRLAAGDEIQVTVLAGTYTYRVREVFAVKPDQVEVVENTPDRSELTLTTCNPKYSARERLVVKADLVENVSPPVIAEDAVVTEAGEPATLAAPEPDSLEQGLDGDKKSLGPTYQWGVFAALVGLAWWWAFRRYRHPLTWLAGVAPFLAVLFGFYYFLERVLPAGY